MIQTIQKSPGQTLSVNTAQQKNSRPEKMTAITTNTTGTMGGKQTISEEMQMHGNTPRKNKPVTHTKSGTQIIPVNQHEELLSDRVAQFFKPARVIVPSRYMGTDNP